MLEYEESYEACVLLKEALEKKGFKVLITRDKDEEMNSYGKDNRLYQAYEANAKYYFRIGFNDSDLDYSGLDISYSTHASDGFAEQILYELNKHEQISISGTYSLNTKGIVPPQVIAGKDDKKVYDQNLVIRESGGQATGASYFSDNAEEGTGFFAKDNKHGIYALEISLGYLSNDKDAKYFKENKEEYMNILADAIYSYIGVIE